MSTWLDFTNSRLYELEHPAYKNLAGEVVADGDAWCPQVDPLHNARQEEQRQRHEDDTQMRDREARSDQYDEARYDAHEDERAA